MKFILNNASTFKGGSEQVALSFIRECRTFPENEYHVVCCANLAAQINQMAYPDNFTFHVLDKRPAVGVVNWCNKMRWFKQLGERIKPDCIVATGGHGYWSPKHIPVVAGFNMAHYIYPESPYLKCLPLWSRIRWQARKHIDFYFYNRVDALFVQTDDVRDRLATRVDCKTVITISNTLNPAFADAEGNTYEPLLPQRDGRMRLLTVSAYYPHKNLQIIPKVLKILKERGRNDFVFVVTLKNADFQNIFPSQYHDSILNVGPVPVAKLPGLYQESDFMFLPTLLECFSASYAEAMAMGKPILTSDMGFAHTVCKDSAVYFDPLNPEDIAKKIVQLASSPERQAQLVENGKKRLKDFGTSNDRARKILELCRQTVEIRARG